MGLQWGCAWLFIDFRNAYDSVRREAEFDIPMKIVRLKQMYINVPTVEYG
jgi:hypothetical protein